jgi:uncharacterized protein YjbI with pentapeptide repeats
MESGTKTVLPQATCKGLTLWPIPEFTDAEVAFGADRRSGANLRSADLSGANLSYAT